MDFSVGQILVEINKESFLQSLCSGLIGAFIGSLISWKVAEHIDKKSQNRWLCDSYLKKKIELELDILNWINTFYEKINLIPDDISEQINNKELADLNKYNKFLCSIYNLDEYKYIHTLLKNYFTFNSNIENLIKAYNNLQKTKYYCNTKNNGAETININEFDIENSKDKILEIFKNAKIFKDEINKFQIYFKNKIKNID